MESISRSAVESASNYLILEMTLTRLGKAIEKAKINDIENFNRKMNDIRAHITENLKDIELAIRETRKVYPTAVFCESNLNEEKSYRMLYEFFEDDKMIENIRKYMKKSSIKEMKFLKILTKYIEMK